MRWGRKQEQVAKLLEDFAEASGGDGSRLADKLEAAQHLRRYYSEISSAEQDFFEAGLEKKSEDLLGSALEAREMSIEQAEIIDRLDRKRRDSSSGGPETTGLEREIRDRYDEMSEPKRQELRNHLSESEEEDLDEMLRRSGSQGPNSAGPAEHDTGSGQEGADTSEESTGSGQEDSGFERDRGYGGYSL
jgi:hypothetical protein